MNIFLIDQHRQFAPTFAPGFYSALSKQARVLMVFQEKWLSRSPENEHPKEIAPNFWVVNRRVLAPYRGILMSDRVAQLDTFLLDQQLARYSRELGWSPDIVEFTSPHFRMHLKCKTGRKRVFWLVDHYSQVRELDPFSAGLTVNAERMAAQHADLTLTTATELLKRFSPLAKQIRFMPNAADRNLYQPLWMRPVPEPELLNKIKRPILGFAGNINPGCDWKMLGVFAKHYPQYSIALLGAMNGPAEFYQSGTFAETLRLPNVHYLGQVPQEELPAYVAHFDAGILFDSFSDFSKTRNHNKVYQNLLSGIPITGANTQPDYQPFAELLYLFDDPRDWPKQCEAALAARDETHSRRRRAYGEKLDWDANIRFRLKIYEALLEEREIPVFEFPPLD